MDPVQEANLLSEMSSSDESTSSGDDDQKKINWIYWHTKPEPDYSDNDNKKKKKEKKKKRYLLYKIKGYVCKR